MIAKNCRRLAEVDSQMAEVSRHVARVLPAAPQGGHRPTGLLENRPRRGGYVPSTRERDHASHPVSRVVLQAASQSSKSLAELQLLGGMEKSQVLPQDVSEAASGFWLGRAHHPRQTAKSIIAIIQQNEEGVKSAW